MRFQADVSVNALHELGRLAGSPDVHRGGHAFVQVMSAIDRALATLERHVVPHDGLGVEVFTDEELVFRAARWIVTTHLDRLDRAFRSSSVIAPAITRSVGSRMVIAPALPVCTEHWSRFLDVLPVARTELGCITSRWLTDRHLDPPEVGATADRDPYVDAVRKACAELCALEQVPAIERMLYRGLASDQRDITGPCEQMLVALRVRVDLPPGRRQWLAHVRWARVAQRHAATAGAPCTGPDSRLAENPDE